MSEGPNQVRLITLKEASGIKDHQCKKDTVFISTKLDTRQPWRSDQQCANYSISHMIPHCRGPIALASFPGSGNTWLRHMIEGAGGIFTGSRYKDLQIQMYGLWGEVRVWNDGTTIVQKTHDASPFHVQKDFQGRGVLIIRNPYEAILSCHNFMYGGHHGQAPTSNYQKTEWPHFLTTQVSKWIDMASNWTIHSTPKKVLVVHYEDLKNDLESSMRSILSFVGLPPLDVERFKCLLKHKAGLFQRKHRSTPDKTVLDAFPSNVRRKMDAIIDHVNEKILRTRGYKEMPLDKYSFYKKNDSGILKDLENRQNETLAAAREGTQDVQDAGNSQDFEDDKAHGAKLVLDQTFKWMSHRTNSDNSELLKLLGTQSDSMSKSAQGFVSKALELWPQIKRPFAQDPLMEVISQEGHRGKNLEDLYLPT